MTAGSTGIHKQASLMMRAPFPSVVDPAHADTDSEFKPETN